MEIRIFTAEDFQRLIDSINDLKGELSDIRGKVVSNFKIYSNKELRELLGVQDKLIRKYRDEGKLAYHKEGDKFWYTQADVDAFLLNNYFNAYAIA